MRYGFIRYSEKEDSSLLKQKEELIRNGVRRDRIVESCKSRIKEGDTIVVYSLYQLGENLNTILDAVQDIMFNHHCRLEVLDFPEWDSIMTYENYSGQELSDAMISILSYINLKESESWKRKQKKGYEAASNKGTAFGRPPKEKPEDFETLCWAWKKRRISSREAASRLGVAQSTFLRWAKESDNDVVIAA